MNIMTQAITTANEVKEKNKKATGFYTTQILATIERVYVQEEKSLEETLIAIGRDAGNISHVRSLRSKLSQLGYYRTPAKPEAKPKGIRKADIIEELREVTGMDNIADPEISDKMNPHELNMITAQVLLDFVKALVNVKDSVTDEELAELEANEYEVISQ